MTFFMNDKWGGCTSLTICMSILIMLVLGFGIQVQAQGSGGGCKIGAAPLSPSSGATISLNDPLILSVNISTDNTQDCNHIGTAWQIATDSSFALNTLVFDSGFSSLFDVESITIQQPQLQSGTTYWWRAYIQVTNAGALEWMEISDTFSTASSNGGGGFGTPTPQILNLSSAQGSSGDVITVSGSGFMIMIDPVFGSWQSTIEFGGQALPTTVVNDFTLEFIVPVFNCGSYTIQVVNPDPTIIGGQPASNLTTFDIPCPQGGGLPTPNITNLSASTANPGDVVSVNGSNFLDFFLGEVSNIYFDGSLMQTTFISNNELRFTVPAIAPCGNVDVHVSTTDGQLNFINSNTVSLNIPCGGSNNPPTPNIQNLSPNSGATGTTVKVNGSNFVETTQNIIVAPGSEILFDSNTINTTYISGTQLEFVVPANASCGNHQVQIRNPGLAVNDPATNSNTTTFNVTSGCSGGGGGNRGNNGTPTANFSYSPSSVQVNQVVQFNNQSTDPDGAADIKSINWSFGDGNNSTSASPSHTYRSTGTFTVQLRVVDSAGNSNSTSQSVTVNGTTGPGPSPGTLSVEQALARAVPNDPNSANANQVIGDQEIKQGVTYWIMGSQVPSTGGQTVGDNKILDLIKKWISASLITTNAAPTPLVSDAEAQYQLEQLMHDFKPAPAPFSLNSVRLQAKGSDRWTLSAYGQGINHIQIQVFDTSGSLRIHQRNNGNNLTLLAFDQHGNRLANGVYLYMVTVFDFRGQRLHSEIKGWVVLR